MKLLTAGMLLPFSIFLTGCLGSNASSEPEVSTPVDRNDTTEATCLGYPSPSLSVAVFNSQTEESISTALVEVHSINSDLSPDAAIYQNTTGNYFNQSPFLDGNQVGLVVSEPNYHTFTTRNLGFQTDTRCAAGSNNDWVYTVYLCPLGTACI